MSAHVVAHVFGGVPANAWPSSWLAGFLAWPCSCLALCVCVADVLGESGGDGHAFPTLLIFLPRDFCAYLRFFLRRLSFLHSSDSTFGILLTLAQKLNSVTGISNRCACCSSFGPSMAMVGGYTPDMLHRELAVPLTNFDLPAPLWLPCSFGLQAPLGLPCNFDLTAPLWLPLRGLLCLVLLLLAGSCKGIFFVAGWEDMGSTGLPPMAGRCLTMEEALVWGVAACIWWAGWWTGWYSCG